MRRIVTIVATMAMLATATAGLFPRPALADEQPIAGTVKSVDPAGTLVVQITAKGKTRDVPIVVKPGAKIVKFVRSTEPGKTGFSEHRLALSDIKPGWLVSVTAKHEGDNEVAEIVKVVLEK